MKCIAKPALVGRTEPLNGLSQTASYRGLFVIYLCFFFVLSTYRYRYIYNWAHEKSNIYKKFPWDTTKVFCKLDVFWIMHIVCFFFFFFFGQWNHLMVTCSYCECKVLHKTVIHDKPRSKTELLNSYN